MAKTQIEDVNRNIYDIKNKDDYDFKMEKGLNREIVEEISKQKNDPDWMREIRLKALEAYEKLELPTWGPDLSELNMEEIATYVKGDKNLDQVIKNIKKLDINWKQYNLIKSSTNYPALQQSISGIYSIANKLFAASLIFAGITVSLLLLLWMNARKKEIAIFLSLGISKLKIFGQFVIELVFISIPAYIGSYFLALYTGNMIGNNILNKVTGNITKQIAKQSASSGLGGGAEVDGFNKTLTSLDINILPKSIIYVILFMSLVLIISLVISSISSLKKSPKELLIDTK